MPHTAEGALLPEGSEEHCRTPSPASLHAAGRWDARNCSLTRHFQKALGQLFKNMQGYSSSPTCVWCHLKVARGPTVPEDASRCAGARKHGKVKAKEARIQDKSESFKLKRTQEELAGTRGSGLDG